MSALAGILNRLRRRKRERVAAERGFLTADERRVLQRPAGQQGTAAGGASKPAAGSTGGRSSGRRPRG